MKSLSIFLLGILALATIASAQTTQLSILHMPQDGMWNLGLMNQGPKGFSVVVHVKIQQGNRLLHALSSRPISLTSGANLIDLRQLEGGEGLSTGLGTQPASENPHPIELCIDVFVEGSRALHQCEIFQQMGVMPPHLVYPFDRDELESTLPMLSWTPPAPIYDHASLRYHLRLVEVVGSQSPLHAMRTMQALVDRQDLNQHVMPYSPSYRALEPGHRYAWQVFAYSGARFLGQSELWTFTIKDPKQEEKIESMPFVELRKQMDSGYYPALGMVRFRFDCLYGEQALNFQVFNERGNPISLSPKQLEQVGRNLFQLNLPVGSGLIENQYYRLTITDNKGDAHHLKFQYQYPRS